MNIKYTAVISAAIFFGLICHAEITKPETELERIAAEIRVAAPNLAEDRVRVLAAEMRESEPKLRRAELQALKQYGGAAGFNCMAFDGKF
jgi:hypothetical protein